MALARHGGVGCMSGSRPPPESVCPHFAQSDDWRLALGKMVGNVTGNEGNDDRRSPRRSWCLSTTQLQRDRRPPAKAAGVAAIVMGATTHGHSAAFFHQILIGVLPVFPLPKLCSWTTPTASKAALSPSCVVVRAWCLEFGGAIKMTPFSLIPKVFGHV